MDEPIIQLMKQAGGFNAGTSGNILSVIQTLTTGGVRLKTGLRHVSAWF